jgi:hypothetical protein
MSDAKHVQDKWRAEDLRAQRKARLARMKSKDGGKKPIQTKNPTSWIIPAAILLAALIGVGLWAAVRLGLPHRSLTALAVGDEKVKVYEVNYYYRSLLSSYGIDPSTDSGKKTLQSASGIEGFPTVDDYIKDIAAQQVQQYVMLAGSAAKDGIALDADDRTRIDSYIKYYADAAQTAGTDAANYLIRLFGPGMTADNLKLVFERQFLAEKFTNAKIASFNITEAEISAYYDAHKDDYDVVSYRTFTIKSTAASDASEADKTKALEAARTKANEMLGKITDDTTYKLMCVEYALESEKEAYMKEDKSLVKDKKKSSLLAAESAWLFDAARKSGDKTVIDATSGYTVLYMVKRARPETQRVDIRHILIEAEKTTATEAEVAAAKSKAESILAEYLAGAQTEDAFAALAKRHSADGNANQGGIYEDVRPGQMVAEFNDWCFDPARQPADTGIVQTQYGFHVMYFIRESGADWAVDVEAALRNDAYTKYVDEELKNHPYTANKINMRFVQ